MESNCCEDGGYIQGAFTYSMKILFATGIYPPEIGGPAGYVKGVATELANQGHKISVVTYGDNPEPNTKYQIANIRRGNSTLIRYVKYTYQSWKLARKSDFVYAQGPVSEGLPATIASFLSRKPLVLKVVGDYAWEQFQQSQSSVELLDEFVTHHHTGKIRVLESIERWVASRAKKIIVPSEYLKTIVEKWGIESDKISVVYNSISPLPDVASRESLRQKHELGDRKLILTAVRAVPWKGGDFLCDVLKDLPNDYALAVAGDGPSLESWKKHAEELGVSNRVAWLGKLSRKDLTEFYQSADLFVLPTGYEGFPHVVVEAASMNLPCIVSDKGGNPEIAKLFPEQVSVAEYQNKQAWIKAITSQNIERHSSKVGLPEVLGFGRMVTETCDVLKSAHCLNLDYQTDSQSNSLDYSNKNTNSKKTGITSADSQILRFSDSNVRDRQRVLSIGLEKKLFKPGKVRDRITDQFKDFDATIIVFAKQKFDEQIAPNIRIISTNSWNKFFYVTGAFLEVWKLRKQKFDIVTSQDPVETGLVAYLSSKILKCAFAIQDHGYHFHGDYYRKESWLNQLRYLFARFVVVRADAIRVVSQRTAGALQVLNVEPSKIIRFPLTLNRKYQESNNSNSSAISDQRTVIQAEDDSARYKIQNTKYLLLVCRFVPIKRIDLAIHAFSIVAKQNPQVKLKIVGGGPLEDQIKRWIADFDLQNRVEITPWTNDLADLYRGATATLITSDREGYGMTAVESLACGTPVIMTNVGCAYEVVKDSINGYIVPVGDVMSIADRMERVINDPNNFTENISSSSPLTINKILKDFIDAARINHNSKLNKNEQDFWRFSELKQEDRQDKKKILVCVQAVDKNDPLMGFFIEWLAEASKQFSEITVLALRVGDYNLPENVKVIALRQKGSSSKLSAFKNLITKSWQHRHNYKGVFVRGDCIYVLLAGWLWRLMGKKIVLWYAHYKTNKCVPWAAKIANSVVTSVPEACSSSRVKAIPIGQAVNSEKFTSSTSEHFPNRLKRFLVFGRVSEVKRVVEIIEAFKKAKPEDSTLTIIGKALTVEYTTLVKQAISEVDNINWLDKDVPYDEVPSIYHEYDILINATPGSLDKTIVEAAMSGLVVVSTTLGSADLYNETNDWLNVNNIESLQRTIKDISEHEIGILSKIIITLRNSAISKHSLMSQVSRLKRLFE